MPSGEIPKGKPIPAQKHGPEGYPVDSQKTTPGNCRLKTCPYNQIAPGENSQECVACRGLRAGLVYRDWKWVPKTKR